MPEFDSYSDLAGANIAVGDEFILKDADGGVVNMTAAELINAIMVLFGGASALSGAGVHATQDKIPIGDNGVGKHILVTELGAALNALATALLGSDAHTTEDTFLVFDNGILKKMTVVEVTSMIALHGLPLADIPEYADQAAAQTGETGTGKLFRFATTGALGVTIA